jgi:hypothetical protein
METGQWITGEPNKLTVEVQTREFAAQRTQSNFVSIQVWSGMMAGPLSCLGASRQSNVLDVPVRPDARFHFQKDTRKHFLRSLDGRQKLPPRRAPWIKGEFLRCEIASDLCHRGGCGSGCPRIAHLSELKRLVYVPPLT